MRTSSRRRRASTVDRCRTAHGDWPGNRGRRLGENLEPIHRTVNADAAAAAVDQRGTDWARNTRPDSGHGLRLREPSRSWALECCIISVMKCVGMVLAWIGACWGKSALVAEPRVDPSAAGAGGGVFSGVEERPGRGGAAVRWGALVLLVGLVCGIGSAGPVSAAVELPGGRYAFAGLVDGSVAVLDRGSSRIVGAVPVDGMETGATASVVFSPRSEVYVLAGDHIAVIDVRSLALVGRFQAPSGARFLGFAVSPNGTRVYGVTVDAAAHRVVVFDSATRQLLSSVPTDGVAQGITSQIAADNTAGYVIAGNVVDVVTEHSSTVTGRIQFPGAVGSLTLDPSQGLLYVMEESGQIAVVHAASRTIVSVIDPPMPVTFPQPMVVSADGSELYTGTNMAGGLQALTAPSGDAFDWLVFRWPIGTPVSAADTSTVYVPLLGSEHLAVIDDWREPDGITMPANVTAVTVGDLLATAPTVTALTAGDGEVEVAFTPGGSTTTTVSSYRVVATNLTGGATTTATGTASPITVPGLGNGDTYTFTVTGLGSDEQPVTETSPPSARIAVGIPAWFNADHPLQLRAAPGRSYTHTIAVVGAPQPTVMLDPGTPLPSWLRFDPATATFSGTPPIDAAGTSYHFFLETFNGVGSDSLDISLNVIESAEEDLPTPAPSAPALPPTPTPTSATPAKLANTGIHLTIPLIAGILGIVTGTALLLRSRARS